MRVILVDGFDVPRRKTVSVTDPTGAVSDRGARQWWGRAAVNATGSSTAAYSSVEETGRFGVVKASIDGISCSCCGRGLFYLHISVCRVSYKVTMRNTNSRETMVRKKRRCSMGATKEKNMGAPGVEPGTSAPARTRRLRVPPCVFVGSVYRSQH